MKNMSKNEFLPIEGKTVFNGRGLKVRTFHDDPKCSISGPPQFQDGNPFVTIKISRISFVYSQAHPEHRER